MQKNQAGLGLEVFSLLADVYTVKWLCEVVGAKSLWLFFFSAVAPVSYNTDLLGKIKQTA